MRLGKRKATAMNMPRKLLSTGFILFALVVCCRISTVSAATFIWTGNINSNWTVSGNWSPTVVPGSTDTAIIPTSGVANPPAVSTAGVTVGSLTINTGQELVLGRDLTIVTMLTLAGGDVQTGASLLILGPNATATRTGGQVFGSMQKQYSGPSSFLFPVGTSTGYAPVDTTVTAGSGNLTITAMQGFPSVIGANHSIQRFWRLSGSGITVNLVFNYLQADVTGTEANYRILRISGTTAVSFINNCAATTPCVDTTANTATIKGVQNFSDWTVGESLTPTAAPATISGRVLAGSGGRPFRLVEVQLQNATTGATSITHTDAKGRFVFPSVPTGEGYVLTATHPGYSFNPGSQLIELIGDRTIPDMVGIPSGSPARRAPQTRSPTTPATDDQRR